MDAGRKRGGGEGIPSDAMQKDDSPVTLAHPIWLIVGCCFAAIAKLTEPSLWIFYPPGEALFGAEWARARLLTGAWSVFLVLFLVAGGLLGDYFGRRRVLLGGLLAATGANALLILGPSTASHFVLRIVAQTSATLVLPLTLAPLYMYFHGRQRLTAFGWYVVVTSLAAVFSSPQANYMLRHFGWQGAYLTSLVFGGVGFVLLLFSLPESRNVNRTTPYATLYAGWTLIVLSAVYLVIHLGFIRVWFVPVMVITTMVMIVGAGFVIWWDVRTPGNLFQHWGVRQRDLTMLIAVGVVIQLVLMGFFLPTFRYFGVVKNYDLLSRLLALLPLFIGMLVAVYFVARIWEDGRVRRLLTLNLAVCSVAIAFLSIAPAHLPYAAQILPLCVFGFSITAAKTIWADAFFQTVIDDYIGLNAAINSATMQIGSALGSALGGHLIVLYGYREFRNQLASFFDPERIRQLYTQLVETTMMAGALSDLDLRAYGTDIWQQYVQSYATGYSQTILTLAGISAATALAIYFGLRRTMRYSAEEVEVDLKASVFEDPLPLLPEDLLTSDG
jgi:predicted MFS family arabinose efflux permease